MGLLVASVSKAGKHIVLQWTNPWWTSRHNVYEGKTGKLLSSRTRQTLICEFYKEDMRLSFLPPPPTSPFSLSLTLSLSFPPWTNTNQFLLFHFPSGVGGELETLRSVRGHPKRG